MKRTTLRKIFAWSLLTISIIGWPVSALTFAANEPFAILSLSWLAITFTAVDILFTTSVENKQDESHSEE